MTNEEHLEGMMRNDPLVWAHTKRLKTKSGLPYTMRGHNYQFDLLQTGKRVTNIKKGTQIGITLVEQIDAIHGLIYKRYPQGVLYMMPSEKQVERFSKLRFTPMFDENRWMKKYLKVNNVNEKIINGGSLIFVGARASKVGGTSVKDSPALRTFECDRVVRDEIDLHDMDMVEQSKQRLNYSDIRQEVNLASPTYPSYGIDALYEQSDQRRWQIKCESCGKYTCIEDTFPDSLLLKDGKWYRACVHCYVELDQTNGEWVAEFPKRDEAGFWISGFLSPRADCDIYMKRYHESEGNKLCEFMRSIMGTASIEAENQLSETVVLSRCTSEPNQMISIGETAMGVDIGKKIHAVVGIRTAREAYDVLNVSRLDTLDELHDLALKMNVHTCVIDSGPYDHGVREFQKKEPYTIYLCQYSEQMPGKPNFDGKTGMVKVNRNEWMDKTHITFADNHIRIPRQSVEMNEYAHEMTRTAKTIIENPDTGLTMGADHYFHSTLYFLLAASRMSPRPRGRNKINRPAYATNNFT